MINYDEIICDFLRLIEREMSLLRNGEESKIKKVRTSTLKSGDEYEIELVYEKANEDDKFLLITLDVVNICDFIVFDEVERVFLIEVNNKKVAEPLKYVLLPPNNELLISQRSIIADVLDTEGWGNNKNNIIDLTHNDYVTIFNIISNINYLIEEESKQLQYDISTQHLLDIMSDLINEEV